MSVKLVMNHACKFTLFTAGYLTGSEEYFSHTRCEIFNKKRGCGMDLHFTDPYSIDRSENGTYSAHLFARKATEIIASHTQDKV